MKISEIVIQLILILITNFCTHFITKYKLKSPLIKDRFEKVISPVYFSIEPILYKDITNMSISDLKIFIEVKDIFCKYKYMVNPQFLYWIDEIIDEENQKSYNCLCGNISTLYDKHCKIYGIYKRCYSYKKIRNLLGIGLSHIFESIKYCVIVTFFWFIFITLFVLAIFSVVYNIKN
jgi:hypothetical protein